MRQAIGVIVLLLASVCGGRHAAGNDRIPLDQIATAPSGLALEQQARPLGAEARDEQQQGIRPQALRCEWLENPTGMTTSRPRFSWIVTAPNNDRNQRQTAYRILTATDEALLVPGKADLWDSARVEKSETFGIVYAGKPLASGDRVVWRVITWDRDGRASEWSEPACFSLGLLDATEWKGEWISPADDSPLHANRAAMHLPPARYFRKQFTLAKPVKRAVLHGTALGLVDWSINGDSVSDELFQPGWSDYRRRVHGRSHDVTRSLLEPGPHCLGAVVADGWYAGYVGYGLLVGYGPHRTGRSIYGKTPAVLCQIDIDYVDGSRESIVSDTSWQVSDAGPIREADFLMGETYDARRELPGWDTAEYMVDQATWRPAVVAAANGSVKAPFFEPGVNREAEFGFVRPAIIDGYAAPPIRVTEELTPQSVEEWQPGVFLFDMGQNFAGTIRLTLAAPAGTSIRMRFGEMRHSDGRLMTENLRRARATDTYICKGEGVETWTPRFTYHGFQFVEVKGLPAGSLPALDTLTGLVIHNDTPQTGQFACSDELLTQFWKNTQWTQRANFIEVPTDCPQRDERLGWMGDAQIYARTATFNADVAAFFTKWIDDVREAQVAAGPHAGAYPDYAPYPFAHGKPAAVFGTAWTDAGVICPWTMWQVYGDIRLIEQHWESMERFMDWRVRLDPKLEGVEQGNTWGDWLNAGEATPIPLIDLCYHTQSARMMAEMAAALGHDTAAALYRERQADLVAAFRRRFVRPDGTLSVATQTACVLSVDTGVMAGAHAAAVVRQLVDRIARNDFRMATGFLGTKSLLPVLSAHGHHDLACRLFQSRKFPSWGYEVEQGANSVWERWDSFTREHGFDGATGANNAAMNSFSHYAFGAVMEWVVRELAGIDMLEPGYGRIRIRPRIPSVESNPDGQPLTWVKADYASPRGVIRSHWKRSGEAVEMRVTIPPNTTAEVHVPCNHAMAVVVDGRPLGDTAEGLRIVDTGPLATVLEVGSGDYVFGGAAAAWE